MSTNDKIIMVLTFIAAVLSLLATQTFVPAEYVQYVLFAVGVINLALTIFFGVAKPVATAMRAGREAAMLEMKQSPTLK